MAFQLLTLKFGVKVQGKCVANSSPIRRQPMADAVIHCQRMANEVINATPTNRRYVAIASLVRRNNVHKDLQEYKV